MLFRRRCLALLLAAWALEDASSASAETAGAAAGTSAQASKIVPPQVTYNFAVTRRGISVETAAYDSIFGTVTLSCLDRGVSAVIGRDAQKRVIYENVMRTPSKDELALRPYSRAFSEIRRTAWNLCIPEQSIASGERRTVEKKGAFPVGGFAFPDEVKIRDQLGSVGCEASASDKTGRATPCKNSGLPQPFVSTLMRQPG